MDTWSLPGILFHLECDWLMVMQEPCWPPEHDRGTSRGGPRSGKARAGRVSSPLAVCLNRASQPLERTHLLLFAAQPHDPAQSPFGVEDLLFGRQAQQVVEYRLRKAGDVHQLGDPGTGYASEAGDLSLISDNSLVEHLPEFQGYS